MTITHAFKYAFNNLRTNKTRTFLTLLGMVIGISSVIIIMALGAGAQSLILNQIADVGSNLVGIMPGGSEEEGPPASVMGITITTLKYEDIMDLTIQGNVSHLEAVTAYVRGTANVSWKNRSIDADFTGTTSSYIDVESTDVEDGRFILPEEERTTARVAVLGSQVANDLFVNENPIGETIKIKRESFKVVGVMEERGVVGFENQDTQIFIPIVAVQKLLLGINHVSMARARIDSEENVDQAVEEIKMTLREAHNIDDPKQDDFTVRSANQALEILGTVTSALNYFLAAIAAISLIVGGVGIMNIMLVAVNERIKEIGLRKAVGAKKSNILTQFLVETVVIALSGGIVGIIIGGVVSALIALVINLLGYEWALIVSPGSIFLACSVSVMVGLVFGLYPSQRASKLDPIEALHYE
ncbi:ABC transporter permease [Patescibacteria group bacterium]|nr:ABC transporter permease [Patescibacteria group bacterium]